METNACALSICSEPELSQNGSFVVFPAPVEKRIYIYKHSAAFTFIKICDEKPRTFFYLAK